mgnify:CR=1 FL=1
MDQDFRRTWNFRSISPGSDPNDFGFVSFGNNFKNNRIKQRYFAGNNKHLTVIGFLRVLSSNLAFVRPQSVLRLTHLSMLWRYIGRYSVKSAVNLSIKVWFTICLATVLQLILKDTCMLSHMHAMRNRIWTQIFSWDLAPDLILNLLSHSIPSHFPAETMHKATKPIW